MKTCHSRTAFISVGDRDWKVEGIAVDSEAAIEALFTALKEDFGVTRILWRGGQDDLLLKSCTLHPENHVYTYGYTRQCRWLRQEVGTSDIAVETAHRIGMEIYLYTAVYRSGGTPDRDMVEDEIRRKYPDCVSVNRYGTLQQKNFIEFCHSEARKEMAQRLASAVMEGGYDGISFYTYIDGPFIRYIDEFGYNRPIVDEYLRRYGVNILNENFDAQKWSELRGEYLTLFFSDLKRRLSSRDKPLMVLINPEDTHLPQCHGSEVEHRHTTTGRIHIDWEKWARDDIVDELSIASKNSTLETIRRGMNEVASGISGTNCQLSVYRPTNCTPLGQLDSAVGEVFHVYSMRIESGFDIARITGPLNPENEISWPEAVAAGDVKAKRRLLFFASEGRVEIGFKDIVSALRDKDLLVRRRALEALAASGQKEAVGHIEESLKDPEHSVRVSAAVALGKAHGPRSLDCLRSAVAADERSPAFLERAAVPALQLIARNNYGGFAEWLGDGNERVRRAALMASLEQGASIAKWFEKGKAPMAVGDPMDAAIPEDAEKAIAALAVGDPHPYNRNIAVQVADRIASVSLKRDIALQGLKDSDVTVQAQAAALLSGLCKSSAETENEGPWSAGINALEDTFCEFGKDGTRQDHEWGWRAFGEALKEAGPEGKAKLEEMMSQRDDYLLADRAWRVLWLPEWNSIRAFEITAESDAEAHRHRPRFSVDMD